MSVMCMSDRLKHGQISIRMSGKTIAGCPKGSPSVRLAMVVLSIGVASHFLLFLDSVVDNLLPAAMPFLLRIYNDKADAHLAWELVVASRLYGLAVGCFLSILMNNKTGRRFPVLLGLAFDILGIVFTMMTVYLPAGIGISAAILGRFINGCGQGIVQITGAVMLVEIPHIKRRGIALASLTMWACVGELLGLLVSLDTFLGRPSTWHFAMALPIIVLIPAWIVMFAAPDSPRFLYMTGRIEEARKAMLFYQSSSEAKQSFTDLEEELDLLHNSMDENGNSKKSLLENDSTVAELMSRFKDGKFVRPLLLAMFIQVFVHLDDWLWIAYSTAIFEDHGLNSATAQKASLGMAIPQALISIGLLGCFDNYARRSLLIYPTLLSSLIGLAAIATVAFEKNLLGRIGVATVLPILASLDLSTAAIAGESAFAVVPELFLPNDKILGTAITGISQNLFGGVLTSFVLTAIKLFGFTLVLVPFVVMNIVYVILNYAFLPETRERTAQEVSKNFSSELPGRNLFAKLQSFTREILGKFGSGKLFCSSFVNQSAIFVLQVLVCVVILNLAYYIFLLTSESFITKLS